MEEIQSKFVLGGRTIYIISNWVDDGFELTLTDGKHAFHGAASASYIRDVLLEGIKVEDLDPKHYLRLTRDALTKQDRKKYGYSLVQAPNSKSDLNFTWTIKFAGSTTNFGMKGMLTVKKLDEARPAIQKLIDTLLEQRGHLTRENKQLSSQNTLLTDQRHKAIDQISRLFIEKDLMEREMYKKFAELLNEKKKKIRELQEELRNRPTRSEDERRADEDEDEVPDATPTRSLTSWGLSATLPTPSMDLLHDADSQSYLHATVRKRVRVSEDSDKEVLPTDPKKSKMVESGSKYSSDSRSRQSHSPQKLPGTFSEGPKQLFEEDDEGDSSYRAPPKILSTNQDTPGPMSPPKPKTPSRAIKPVGGPSKIASPAKGANTSGKGKASKLERADSSVKATDLFDMMSY